MLLVVQMEVKADDADVNARGEKVIYGRGRVDVKKGEDVARVPVAYAYLPLVDARSSLLADDQHVYDAIHSTYMSQTPKAFDKKPLFVDVSAVVAARHVGRAAPLHGRLRRARERELALGVAGRAAGGARCALVRWHSVLLNQLLALMCDTRHVEVSRDAFVSFVFVVDTVASATGPVRTLASDHDSRTGRNATLDSYVHHFFPPPDASRHTVHETLVRRTSRTQEAQHIQLELYGWFLFDLVVKSLRVGAAALADDMNRAARLAADGEQASLLTDLRTAVEALALQVKNNIDLQEESARLLNRALAFFLLDLLSLLDRGAVFGLIDRYFATLDAHSRYLPLVRLKVTCLRIFNQYEHCVLVNLPVPIALERRSRDLLSRFWKQHFLVGLQLAEVRQCLDDRQKEIRVLAGNALLEQLAFVDAVHVPPRHQRVVDSGAAALAHASEVVATLRALLRVDRNGWSLAVARSRRRRGRW
jgi:hypothetical protein